MTTSKQFIAYWRDSLLEADLANLELVDANHVRVSSDALEYGQLDHLSTKTLFAQNKSNYPKQDHTMLAIPVVVAPIVAHSNHWQRRQRTLCPLFIPAVLEQNGRLQAEFGHQRPWIPRSLLEPTNSDLVIGSIDDFNDFFDRQFTVFTTEEAIQGWTKCFQLAWKMLRHVTRGAGQQILQEAGYQISAKAAVISLDKLWGISANILGVYRELLASSQLPPLLATYLAPEPANVQHQLSYPDWLVPAWRHLGSFSNQFPLSPSQRQALYHFLNLEKSSVLAVSGPPGTGKTTLLHSVIASLWAQAALQQTQPPVIVVTSTNNQAVTNVIDSLANVSGVQRWLPIPGFGLYLVNTQEKMTNAAAQGILAVNNRGDGFVKEVETTVFVNQGREAYLAACSQFLNQPIEHVDQAVQLLHQQMQAKVVQMNEGLTAALHLHRLTQLIEKLNQQGGLLDTYETNLQQEISRAQQELEKWQAIRKAWLHYQQAEPAYYTFLAFIPGIRRKRAARYGLFVAEKMSETAVSADPTAISAAIEEQIKNASQSAEQAQQALQALHQLYQSREANLVQWQQFQETSDCPASWKHLFDLEEDQGETDRDNLLNWLDVTYRHEIFALATHYWEGRWLQAMEQEQRVGPIFREACSRTGQEKKWQRYAMLTPCFVTTMHTGPSFFNYYNGRNKPMLNYIDLLIIDEAGQVSPEISGGMIALAKQALVVGDVKQIEPIWGITPPVDIGNLRRHKLGQTETEFNQLQARGITSSSGSAMQIAQHVSPYQLPAKNGMLPERGMFLAEHRRCVPEIIEYCNTLAYNGRLRPMRPSLVGHPWPHLGYVHVKGQSLIENGSRKNEREAQALVAWIADNQAALVAHYGQELEEIVGVVTPFTAQKRILRQLLKKRGLKLSKVGTVHALQGGERPIIIFSSVYTTRDGDISYFFDRGPNMLNVAVSRAQDSFIVFGDMDIFDPHLTTPSGILARHLFAREENEMVGVPLPERQLFPGQDTLDHIRTLDKHVRALQRAFTRAQQRLVIVSPYLRWRAVVHDGICQQVEEAVKRGVVVNIYIDQRFNENLTLPSANKAASALRSAGAQVHICHNIHSKVICIDEDVFIEGSFNWLSAERTLMEYSRYETSIIYIGPMAPQFIAETLTDIEQRVINKTNHEQRTETIHPSP